MIGATNEPYWKYILIEQNMLQLNINVFDDFFQWRQICHHVTPVQTMARISNCCTICDHNLRGNGKLEWLAMWPYTAWKRWKIIVKTLNGSFVYEKTQRRSLGHSGCPLVLEYNKICYICSIDRIILTGVYATSFIKSEAPWTMFTVCGHL